MEITNDKELFKSKKKETTTPNNTKPLYANDSKDIIKKATFLLNDIRSSHILFQTTLRLTMKAEEETDMQKD